jgi:hypothetical protein
MRLLIENKPITEISEVTPALASTLRILRNDLDSGRLAVGYIYTKFNEQCDPAQKLKSEKAMGALLRKHGLTISPGQHDANGRRGVCCLSWDKKTEEFVQTLQTSPKPSPHQETSANTVETDIADIPEVVDGEKYDIEGDIL